MDTLYSLNLDQVVTTQSNQDNGYHIKFIQLLVCVIQNTGILFMKYYIKKVFNPTPVFMVFWAITLSNLSI